MPENISQCKLTVGSQPLDCKFHSQMDKLLISTISGHLALYGIKSEQFQQSKQKQENVEQLWKMRVSKYSCRGVNFDGTGKLAITVSKGDIMAVDVESGQPLSKLSNSHESDINKVLPITETAFIAADDGGEMKIWDTRQTQSVCSFDHHKDAVSDIILHDREDSLIAVSQDGTISVIDVNKLKCRAQSEENEAEYLSVSTVRAGDNIVCGCSDGVLGIFKWGYFNDFSDRYPGHREQINCMQKINETTIFTGCEDGVIRMLHIFPNKVLCEVGKHKYPVESVSVSLSQQWLATCTHSPIVQLWDIRSCINKYCNDSKAVGDITTLDKSSEGGRQNKEKRKSKTNKKQKAASHFKQVKQQNPQNFFDDLVG